MTHEIIQLHDAPTADERASTGGRARGLLGGLFGGCMMAAQKSGWTNPYVTDGLINLWDGLDVGDTWIDRMSESEIDCSAATVGANHVTVPSGVTISGVSAVAGTTSCTIELVLSLGTKSTTSFNSSYKAFGVYNGSLSSARCAVTIPYGAGRALCWTSASSLLDVSRVRTVTIGGGIGTAASFYCDGTAYAIPRLDAIKGVTPSTAFSLAGACDIYSIRVYNRAITASEVAANYTVDKERFGL